MKYLFLIMCVILLCGCECIVNLGPYNHSFIGDNASICEEDCMIVHANYNCSKYTWEWHKFNKTENCTCDVDYCFIE